MAIESGLIVVAGGGIGGLAAAVGLQGAGAEVLVLEREQEIRDAGAGISLWPNALAALDCLGLGEVVRPLGMTLAAGGERKRNGAPGLHFTAGSLIAALGEGLVCVDRGLLVRALVDRLVPGTLRTGRAVTGYRHRADSLIVEVEGQDHVEAAALIGADGIHSVVARQINRALTFSYSGYTAWRGIADTVHDEDRDRIMACLAGGHEVGWLPVGPSRTYWFATAWLPESHQLVEGDKEYLLRTFVDWPAPALDLIDRTPADRLVRNDIVDRAPLASWTDRRVTLLGDAAHPMRPHLGQGGCQAIEDAARLVTCLQADGHDPGRAFRSYSATRRKRAERVVRLSRYARLTRPPTRMTAVMDSLTGAIPSLPVGRALQGLRPIAGYAAGRKAATGNGPASGTSAHAATSKGPAATTADVRSTP